MVREEGRGLGVSGVCVEGKMGGLNSFFFFSPLPYSFVMMEKRRISSGRRASRAS